MYNKQSNTTPRFGYPSNLLIFSTILPKSKSLDSVIPTTLQRINDESNLPYKERAAIDLVQQVLNSRLNTYQDFKSIGNLFRIYANILKKTTSEEFSNSLLMSQESVLGVNTKLLNIDKLKPNNLDSFLIIPIISQGHLFSAVIRNDENKTKTVTIVNKGARTPGTPMFLELKMTTEKLAGVLTIIGNKKYSIPEVYNIFAQNANQINLLKTKNRNQKIGNCFIKEPENAIKYALHTRTFSKEQFADLKTGTNKIKWPISTTEIHRQFVNECIKENPKIAEALKGEFKTYEDNKIFRKAFDVSIEPKKALYDTFDPKSVTENLETQDRIKVLLRNINYDSILQRKQQLNNLATLTNDFKYSSLFKQVVENSIKARELVMNVEMREKFEDFLSFFTQSDNFISKTKKFFETATEHFPHVIAQMKLDYHISYFVTGGNLAYNGKYKEALEKLDFAIEMYPHNSPAYAVRGLIYNQFGDKTKATNDVVKALELNPDDPLAKIALKEITRDRIRDKNEDKNSIRRAIIDSQNPNKTDITDEPKKLQRPNYNYNMTNMAPNNSNTKQLSVY